MTDPRTLYPAPPFPREGEELRQGQRFRATRQPVELAHVFVLLASKEASFINGEVYGVTGGKGVA